ncbi:MAG: efflux RND transporter periplasmic adaptor subunit [Chthoniobacterales bacterium]|nr:efflux RND transporter periplasmic adaptor subunit [Chthoniobacterales bacterium]
MNHPCTSQIFTRLGAATLLVCLLAACGRGGDDAGPRGGGEVVMQVETLRIAAQPFEEKLTATGSLQADEEVMLRPERSGIIEAIHFTEGEQVEEGRVLVKLRGEDLQAQVERMEAQLQLAQREGDRQETLAQRQAISRSEVDQAKSSVAVARAEVDLAKAELAKTEVRAPFSGVVGLRSVSVGGFVTPTTDIASFRRLDPLKLELNVPERYGRFIRPELRVEFSVAGTDQVFTGTVYALEPGIDEVSRTVRLRARVANPEGKLTPGAFVEAQLVLDRIEDAIIIPSLAVVPGLKEETVFVAKDGKAEVRKVTTGIRTADAVLIEEGLRPGDEIITSSILQLRAGARIAPAGARGDAPVAAPSPPAS